MINQKDEKPSLNATRPMVREDLDELTTALTLEAVFGFIDTLEPTGGLIGSRHCYEHECS